MLNGRCEKLVQCKERKIACLALFVILDVISRSTTWAMVPLSFMQICSSGGNMVKIYNIIANNWDAENWIHFRFRVYRKDHFVLLTVMTSFNYSLIHFITTSTHAERKDVQHSTTSLYKFGGKNAEYLSIVIKQFNFASTIIPVVINIWNISQQTIMP